MFGRLDKISTSFSHDSKQPEYSAEAHWPILWNRRFDEKVHLQLDVIPARTGEFLKHSSLSTQKYVALLAYLTGPHKFQYEWCWRDTHLGYLATEPLLKEGGHSVKSSLKYQYTLDTRDNPFLPTKGFSFKFVQEFAGLGGTIKFIGNEVGLQYNWPIGPPELGFAINLASKGGLHVPLGNSRSHICDRFFLGGPMSFRGFEHNGVGPRWQRDSYGGDVLGNSSLHLSWPIVSNVRGHLFGQIGNLISLREDVGLKGNLQALLKEYRLSVGCGIFINFAGFRVELNFSHPLKKEANDATKNFQFGIGVDLLD